MTRRRRESTSSSSRAPKTWCRCCAPARRGPTTVRARDGYRVTRYRPRIEGLFARIERWTCARRPATVHWRSISKDNILTVYGLDAQSRIADPEQSRPRLQLADLPQLRRQGQRHPLRLRRRERHRRRHDARAERAQPHQDRQPLSRSASATAIACRCSSTSTRDGRAAAISSRTTSTPRNGCSRSSSTTAKGTTAKRRRTRTAAFWRVADVAATRIGRCAAIRSPPIAPASRSALTGCAAAC